MEKVKEACRKIAALEIQGATNVAHFAVQALVDYVKELEGLNPHEILKRMEEVKKELLEARATEPTLRNGLNYVTRSLAKRMDDKKQPKLDNIPEAVLQFAVEYKKMLDQSKDAIAEYGARRIPQSSSPNRFVIFTHCHSSVVTGILIEAHKQGKEFDVICTETRPRYQGRLTATELADAGIHVIQVVDSAMRWAIKNYEADLILIGADAITSDGTVLNKIGSRLLALVAREEHVPFYVASPLLKYNPETVFGGWEKIDMRDGEEIWGKYEKKPKNIEVLNPAFETVARMYINALITEAGVFPPENVHWQFRERYPLLV
jgi:ribose 1,5-bisphosphate isomerase